MNRIKRFPAPAPTQAPPDHLQRNRVIELPYLHDGRRVFVATDERGWIIARGLGSTDAECEQIIITLNDALVAPPQSLGPKLVSDAS